MTCLTGMQPLFTWIAPAKLERAVVFVESRLKGSLFDCRMCGSCVLNTTGMSCPMNCPKELRNGPCGGVRANGHCEVIPELPCVWVQAWERSQHMQTYTHEFQLIQPPVNQALQGTSAWINLIEKVDTETPPGWKLATQAPLAELIGRTP